MAAAAVLRSTGMGLVSGKVLSTGGSFQTAVQVLVSQPETEPSSHAVSATL